MSKYYEINSVRDAYKRIQAYTNIYKNGYTVSDMQKSNTTAISVLKIKKAVSPLRYREVKDTWNTIKERRPKTSISENFKLLTRYLGLKDKKLKDSLTYENKTDLDIYAGKYTSSKPERLEYDYHSLPERMIKKIHVNVLNLMNK